MASSTTTPSPPRTICGDCFGTGRTANDYRDPHCPLCAGPDTMECSACDGTGTVPDLYADLPHL
ncbi:hypothetical protein [Streptomyces sp. NPDC088554]|uniref:hypothetical protein n=1 Tax=Streptomyces sp. NPDC088554 TaxID=3365865 RepID=UPI003820C07F